MITWKGANLWGKLLFCMLIAKLNEGVGIVIKKR